MTVYRKNITINVGETFSEDLTLLGSDGNGVVNLTGYSAQSKLRKSPTNYISYSLSSPIYSREIISWSISLSSLSNHSANS